MIFRSYSLHVQNVTTQCAEQLMEKNKAESEVTTFLKSVLFSAEMYKTNRLCSRESSSGLQRVIQDGVLNCCSYQLCPITLAVLRMCAWT
eukprot:5529448-Amphidinium_carterae.1